MISTGDTITNPVTGEQMTFIRTSRDTDGEAVVIEVVVQPHGFVAAAHLHPTQEERFEIIEGTLGFKVGGERLSAGPGERLTVPANTRHTFWNAGDGAVRFRCEIRPALQFESLLETMFGLAEDGRTNRRGMPNPLRLAVIAHAHRDVVLLPFPPRWMQLTGLALGAPLGRLLGYRPTYVPASRAASVPDAVAPALVAAG